MNFRHLQFFVTLARERHFGRAAAASCVTQPTLSEALQQLERELAVPLIDRDRRRFRGLTSEGERVLAWATRILSDQVAMEQELAQLKGELSGVLRLGVIPAAMPVVPFLTKEFCARYPKVKLKILSLSSIEIQRGLDSGELAAGLTYLENEPLRNVRTFRLYEERYLLLTPPGGPFSSRSEVTWREAGTLPMCLLTSGMQNRRIIDRLFEDGGAQDVQVMVETDSILAQITHVCNGGWSSIVPHTFLTLLAYQQGPGHRPEAIPVTAPAREHVVGLVTTNRDPLPPLARALVEVTERLDVAAQLDRALGGVA